MGDLEKSKTNLDFANTSVSLLKCKPVLLPAIYPPAEFRLDSKSGSSLEIYTEAVPSSLINCRRGQIAGRRPGFAYTQQGASQPGLELHETNFLQQIASQSRWTVSQMEPFEETDEMTVTGLECFRT